MTLRSEWSYLFSLLTMGGILHLQTMNVCIEAASIEQRIVDSAPHPAMFDFFHVVPSGKVEVMTEYDLLLTLEQYQALYNTDKKTRVRRKAIREVNTRWTDCYVYYEIHDSLDTSSDRAVIKQAMDEWEKYTCLTFKESSTHEQRVQFKDGGGCYSKLGMQDEPQPLVLARGCRTKGTIAHEIGHAIGWIHEHMRPDRDEFVYVNLDVIDKVHHDNYKKYTDGVINTYNISYDYTSLMHYGNGVYPESLLALDPKYQDQMGQRDGLSFKDIKLANVMYECHKMFCRPQKDCKDGFQMSKSYKGRPACECWCDSGDVNDPLMLCSERKTPPPPPQPSPKPTEMPKKKCIDLRKDCRLMKQVGYCMTKMDMMMRFCSKTCEFCDKGQNVCMDYDKGCPIMAAAQACEKPGFQEKMHELCKGSCDLCPKPPNPCDIQHEMMGDYPSSGLPGSAWTLSCLAFSWLLPCLVSVIVSLR